MDITIKISTKTVLIALGIPLGVWLAIQLQTIILILLTSTILALALTPLVDQLEARRVPHGIAATLVVLGLFLAILGVGAVGLTPLIDQTQRLIQRFPDFLNTLSQAPGVPEALRNFNQTLVEQFNNISGNVLKITLGAFSGVLTLVSVIFLTLYILLDLENLKSIILSSLGKVKHQEVAGVIDEVQERLGMWLKTQLLLMTIVGLMNFVGLSLIGVAYALPLALLAGLLEAVPTLGPILAAVPAAIVGFAMSPLTGIGVVALAILVQQVENYVIVPKLMQRTVGFNPLVTMLIILTAGKLFGLLGVLISIPSALVISVIGKYLLK